MSVRRSNDYRSFRAPQRLVRKSRKSPSSLNGFGEEPDKEGAMDGDQTHTGKKKPSKPGHKEPENSVAPMTAVPDPVPDTGLHSPNLRNTLPAKTVLPTSATGVHYPLESQTSIFKPLPPLLSASASSVLLYSRTQSLSPPATGTASFLGNSSGAQALHQSHPHHVSVAVIAISAVGSAFVLLGLIIIIKACSCPRRRMHPTPSLPIFEDSFDEDDQLKVDSSPLFGGNERYSRPENELWTWTQYLQPEAGVAKPLQVAGHDAVNTSESQGLHRNDTHLITQNYPCPREKRKYPFVGSGSGPITPANSFQQIPSVLTRAVSRLSAASMTLYPNYISKDSQTGCAPLTADNHPIIKRTSSNALKTMGKAMEIKRCGNNDSIQRRPSQGLAYDGADVLSPQLSGQPQVIAGIALAPPAAVGVGRSRIKSTYYAPGAYPRNSAAPPTILPSTKSNFPDDRHPILQQTRQKSESRRARDTHALTLALGLESPINPPLASPQPTLYPDDSLSVVEEARSQGPYGNESRNDRSNKKPVPKISQDSQNHAFAMMSPAGDTSTALGNLMLMDYAPTFKSLASLRGQDAPFPSSTLPMPLSVLPPRSTSNLKKTFFCDDKPPRVPSPPPLPSLVQMGLAHANPESYANYRSPTYSIYGLYENERKSRAGSVGY